MKHHFDGRAETQANTFKTAKNNFVESPEGQSFPKFFEFKENYSDTEILGFALFAMRWLEGHRSMATRVKEGPSTHRQAGSVAELMYALHMWQRYTTIWWPYCSVLADQVKASGGSPKALTASLENARKPKTGACLNAMAPRERGHNMTFSRSSA